MATPFVLDGNLSKWMTSLGLGFEKEKTGQRHIMRENRREVLLDTAGSGEGGLALGEIIGLVDHYIHAI